MPDNARRFKRPRALTALACLGSPGDLVELTRSDAAWTAKFTRDRYQLALDPKKNLAVMADLAKTSSREPRSPSLPLTCM